MKPIALVGSLLASALTGAQAAIVAQWPFNSPVPDDDTSTGTTAPVVGTGLAWLVGDISGSFVSGDPKSDPAGSTDNSGWNTTTYPAAATGNKSAGVRFDVSTEGYEKIWVSWAQRHSSTASRYTRVQYTLDGYTFMDADVIAVYADSVFTNKIVSFSDIPGAANNPFFGFRMVSEFENSATGSGTNAYVATKAGSAYRSSGTIRFDMVTVSGTLLPGANTPPGLSSLTNQTLRVSQTLGPFPFLVWDQEDAAGALVLSKTSSNPAVVGEWDIAFGGSGQNRTLTLTAGQQPGTSVITVSVTDSGGKSSHTSFTVTVLAANTAPVIYGLARTNTVMGSPVVLPFTVGDLESPAAALTVSGTSANPLLVPSDSAHLLFGGSGSNRTVTVTPAPGQTGVAPITVSVSDGVNTSSAVFPFLVTPSANV
ncbi:MAG TPA: hypothetical protein VNT26_09040, partial [Candidatus Sulfotelmatobacter sp.]|nr:hypothetical protein [Candidatus Sulfotelmatobacter sp.]